MSPFPNNPFRRKFWNLFNNVLTGLWELGLSFLGSLRYVCLEFLVVMKAQEKAEVILGFHCWRAAEPLTGGFVIGCPWELPKCLVLWNACFSYTHMNQKTFCLEKSNTGGLKKKKSHWSLDSCEATIMLCGSQTPDKRPPKLSRKHATGVF